MSEQHRPAGGTSQEELQDLVAAVDTGGPAPDRKAVAVFLAAVAFLWPVLQLWYASQICYEIGFGVFNTPEARPHPFSFASFLGFFLYQMMLPYARPHLTHTLSALAVC